MHSLCCHLTSHQSLVRAATDWEAFSKGWLFLRVCDGQGYLMHGKVCQEIQAGDFMVFPSSAKASVRASQLGDLRLCHFGMLPEQLMGFFTAGERRSLSGPLAIEAAVPCVIHREDALARQRSELCLRRRHEPNVVVRSAMLALAVQSLRDLLTRPSVPANPMQSPKERLATLAAQVPEGELLGRSTADLARECGCSERHLRRLFAEQFGTSLLRRQIEWRIQRAKQLLLETDAKIVDIAGQCGFPSLGLFNVIFKRQTRMTPGNWRVAFAATQAKFKRKHPSRCPQQIGPPPPARISLINVATNDKPVSPKIGLESPVGNHR